MRNRTLPPSGSPACPTGGSSSPQSHRTIVLCLGACSRRLGSTIIVDWPGVPTFGTWGSRFNSSLPDQAYKYVARGLDPRPKRYSKASSSIIAAERHAAEAECWVLDCICFGRIFRPCGRLISDTETCRQEYG